MKTNYTQADHDEFIARMDRQAEQFRRDLESLNALEERALLLQVAITMIQNQIQLGEAA